MCSFRFHFSEAMNKFYFPVFKTDFPSVKQDILQYINMKKEKNAIGKHQTRNIKCFRDQLMFRFYSMCLLVLRFLAEFFLKEIN